MATQVPARVLLHICFVPRCTQTKLQTGFRQTAPSSSELEESPSSVRKKDFRFCLLSDQQGLSLFPLPSILYKKKNKIKKESKEKGLQPSDRIPLTLVSLRGERLSLCTPSFDSLVSFCLTNLFLSTGEERPSSREHGGLAWLNGGWKCHCSVFLFHSGYKNTASAHTRL